MVDLSHFENITGGFMGNSLQMKLMHGPGPKAGVIVWYVGAGTQIWDRTLIRMGWDP